ncbi:MAG: acyltransferase [Pseudomonadota bacterium]|nr:acyltransferase [Pseudomonadota bacterium]
MVLGDDGRAEVPAEAKVPARIPALDSLRGIAAFGIMSWHIFLTLPQNVAMDLQWITLTPFRMMPSAVIIFYMLSGFVLSLSYVDGKPPRYSSYLIRRTFRLYIPFVATVAAAFVLYAVMQVDRQSVNDMVFHKNALAHPGAFTLCMFGRALLATGLRDDDLLNPAMWTLSHEIRISLIFPLLVLLCRRSWLGVLFMMLCYILVRTIQARVGNSTTFPALTDDYLTTWLATIYYVPCFMFGIFLAKHRKRIVTWLARLPKFTRIILWVLVAVNLWFIPDFDIRQPFTEIGAFTLLALILSSARVKRMMEAAPLQWLGKISYSLYLVHVPVLLVLRHSLDGRLPLAITYTLFVFTALAIADLSYRFIEVPAIAWGKTLARKA